MRRATRDLPLRPVWWVFVALLLVACGSRPAQVPTAATASSPAGPAAQTGGPATASTEAERGAAVHATPQVRESSLLESYQHALDVARYPVRARVSDTLIALVPDQPGLRWDAQGRVLMYTWTVSKYYADEKVYAKGKPFQLYGETWFTTAAQVHDVCSQVGPDASVLNVRIAQYLGLPPPSAVAHYDAFLAVWVDPGALKRPCADPHVDTTTCDVAAPMVPDGADQVNWSCGASAADAHAQWLCNTWVDRYSNSKPSKQYPWTALGYTYDWGSTDGVGASEFVASAKTNVVFESLTPTATFCAADVDNPPTSAAE